MKISEKIEQFLNLWDDIKKIHSYNFNAVEECNKASTDFLHIIELDKTTYAERSKLTTAEKANRIKRRKAKDMVEIYEHLLRFSEVEESRRAVNLLKQMLGEIRKTERYHENRSYRTKTGDGKVIKGGKKNEKN